MRDVLGRRPVVGIWFLPRLHHCAVQEVLGLQYEVQETHEFGVGGLFFGGWSALFSPESSREGNPRGVGHVTVTTRPTPSVNAAGGTDCHVQRFLT